MKVSVVVPVYNSSKYLREAIDSVIAQDFTDREMLIINEYGSDDGSAEIITEYEKRDERIRLVQNEKKLGLAESLNLGIRLSKGEYVARLDADDLAVKTRFSKQVEFLDGNLHIGVCGSWQHHFGAEEWIHKPPEESELCRAYLLFWCHLCHSTVMIRKTVITENNLFYDGRYLAEDFELWSRAVAVVKFANIPEVLGLYRHSSQNITDAKRQALGEESGHIVASALKRFLKIDLPETNLLNAWENIYARARFQGKRKEMLKRLEFILRGIWAANRQERFYDDKALLLVIQAKWRWAKYGVSWQEAVEEETSIDLIFSKRYHGAFYIGIKLFLANNPTFIGRCRKIFRFVCGLFGG